MSDYHNPAGRLLKVLTELGQGQINREPLATKLGTPNDWRSILNAIADMRTEYELLEAAVSEFTDNPHKLANYREDLIVIKTAIDGININMHNNSIAIAPQPTAITALRYMAVDLPQEEAFAQDEIEEIRKLCDELRSEIQGSQTLNKTLKEWLLDLVRMMRDGIDCFKIRGSRGFRKELYEMLGSIMVHYKDVKKVTKEEPAIWMKMMQGLDRVCRAAERFEKVKKGFTITYKFIEYFSGGGSTPLQLESPEETEQT
jgi:ribosome-interacting GTPase 1